MIQASHLTKKIGNQDLLSDISFKIKEGELVGFLGPNGAGKTSTMRILSCTMKRSSGELSMFSLNPEKDTNKIRSQIGYLPERPALYPQLSVTEQIRLIAELKGTEKNSLNSTVDQLISKCRLTEVLKKTCNSLSKGFRQKVGLACAIIGEPKLLILDEPTSGLDPKEIVEIRSLIKSLQEKSTIIISSHLLGEVSNLCKRALIFVKGRTVLDLDLNSVENLEKTFLEAIENNSQ